MSTPPPEGRKPSREFELADANTIKFTRQNAEFHIGNLLAQLRDVYKDGKLNLDRLNNVAHW